MRKTLNLQRTEVSLRKPASHRTRFTARSPSPRYVHTHAPYFNSTVSDVLFEQSSVPGSLSVDAVCQEGVFVIENLSYYNDAKLATDLSPEADWKRRGLYIGPQVCHPPFTPSKARVLGCIVLSV